MRIELSEKDIKTALEDYILKRTGCEVSHFDNNWRITRGNKENIESVGIGCELKEKLCQEQSSMGTGMLWNVKREESETIKDVFSYKKQEISQRVVNVITLQLDVSPERIKKHTTKDDLGMDSLDDIEVIMNIEEEFDIEIEDSEAERLNTVEDLVNLVLRLVKGE